MKSILSVLTPLSEVMIERQYKNISTKIDMIVNYPKQGITVLVPSDNLPGEINTKDISFLEQFIPREIDYHSKNKPKCLICKETRYDDLSLCSGLFNINGIAFCGIHCEKATPKIRTCCECKTNHLLRHNIGTKEYLCDKCENGGLIPCFETDLFVNCELCDNKEKLPVFWVKDHYVCYDCAPKCQSYSRKCHCGNRFTINNIGQVKIDCGNCDCFKGVSSKYNKSWNKSNSNSKTLQEFLNGFDTLDELSGKVGLTGPVGKPEPIVGIVGSVGNPDPIKMEFTKENNKVDPIEVKDKVDLDFIKNLTLFPRLNQPTFHLERFYYIAKDEFIKSQYIHNNKNILILKEHKCVFCGKSNSNVVKNKTTGLFGHCCNSCEHNFGVEWDPEVELEPYINSSVLNTDKCSWCYRSKERKPKQIKIIIQTIVKDTSDILYRFSSNRYHERKYGAPFEHDRTGYCRKHAIDELQKRIDGMKEAKAEYSLYRDSDGSCVTIFVE